MLQLFSSSFSGWLSVTVVASVLTFAQDPTTCANTGPGIGSPASAIADSIATVPGLTVSNQSPIIVGGLRGVTIDLSKNADLAGACPPPHWEILTQPDVPSVGISLCCSGRVVRVILLDRGDGQTLLIYFETEGAFSDPALANTMSVIKSFEFTR